MFDQDNILVLQQAQYSHDKRNHFDILARHKIDRLKHYGLHFGKYAGRLSMGENASGKSERQTAVDSILVSLSAANALHDRLLPPKVWDTTEKLKYYTTAMGRFCDGVEKIDHLEFDEIRKMLSTSNQHLFEIAFSILNISYKEMVSAIEIRREALRKKAFYVED